MRRMFVMVSTAAIAPKLADLPPAPDVRRRLSSICALGTDQLQPEIDHGRANPKRCHLRHHGSALREAAVKGRCVEQSNFDTYRILRMNEAPAIEVHIVQSSEAPGGMGETGTSALVSAVANAIFAATGKRLRDAGG